MIHDELHLTYSEIPKVAQIPASHLKFGHLVHSSHRINFFQRNQFVRHLMMRPIPWKRLIKNEGDSHSKTRELLDGFGMSHLNLQQNLDRRRRVVFGSKILKK